MRRIFSKILLMLLGLAVAFLCAEVGLRALGSFRKGPLRSAAQLERPARYFMPNPSMNAQDRAFSRKKERGVFRIAVVGDSFSFAPKMQFDDTFSKRLERYLNLNSSPAGMPSSAEVINFGTPGFGLVQEEHLVKEALTYDPDLILLQVTLNDAQLRPLNLEPADIQRKFGRLPLDVSSSWWLRNFALVRLVAERMHNQQTVNNYIQYHHDLFSNPISRDPYLQALDRIAALVNAAPGAPKIVAAIFPLFDFPLTSAPPHPYPFLDLHQSIAALFRARGIGTIDLFKRFKNIPIERLQLIPGVDSHPNEIAHRIAAEYLLQTLAKRSLIPDSLLPSRVQKGRDNVIEPSLSWAAPDKQGKAQTPPSQASTH